MLPDVGHGQDDELGECAVAIDADAHSMGAEVAAAGEAVAAAAADDVAFARDDGAEGEVFDVRADGDDFADELVADGQARLDDGAGPCVPLIYMEVGPADASVEDTDFYVVDAHFGLGNVFEPQTRVLRGSLQVLSRGVAFLDSPGAAWRDLNTASGSF